MVNTYVATPAPRIIVPRELHKELVSVVHRHIPPPPVCVPPVLPKSKLLSEAQ